MKDFKSLCKELSNSDRDILVIDLVKGQKRFSYAYAKELLEYPPEYYVKEDIKTIESLFISPSKESKYLYTFIYKQEELQELSESLLLLESNIKFIFVLTEAESNSLYSGIVELIETLTSCSLKTFKIKD